MGGCVQTNRLKGRSSWQVSIPHNASWRWKKILKLRNIAKQFLKHRVKDGRNIFLSYDNWHLAGCLIDVYGYKTVYDAGSAIVPKLSYTIRRDWYWPSARS